MSYSLGMSYYEVRTGSRVRFQSVRLAECEEHARKVFKAEGVIAEIYEVSP